MWIVVTDLDGTLLNHDDYSWQGARTALATLEERGIPVIFCTSKTRAEVQLLRGETGNRHPFIVENGGAAYFPAESFATAVPDAVAHEGLLALELGTRYDRLVKSLAEAALETGCTVRGFFDATKEEVAAWCGFSEAEAALAKEREYDEPFLLLDGDEASLLAAIETRGLRWTRGGRFWHILGANDKGLALRAVRTVYEAFGAPVKVVALGDSPNDLPLLADADFPIVMPSARTAEMLVALPHSVVARRPGSHGWGDVVMASLTQWLENAGEIPREPLLP